MATIVTRTGKGSALTTTELDANFTNLNADKAELSGAAFTGNITFTDNSKAIFGAGSDLQIYHDGSNSYIKDTGSGDLIIEGSDNIWLMKAGGSEVFLNTADDGAVTLYHNGSSKLATTSTGVDVTGDVSLGDNGKAKFGASQDLQIYHDGANNYIEGQTGSIIIQNTNDDYNVIIKSDNGSGGLADYFRAKGTTGSAIMYHYGSEKLATTSTGVDVTGTVTADAVVLDHATSYYAVDKTLSSYASNNGVYLNGNEDGWLQLSGDGVNRNTRITLFGDDQASANNMLFHTNGLERMRLTSTGLGIGTSSVGTKLDVSTEANKAGLRVTAPNTTNQSFGATFTAGTSSSDYSLNVDSAAGSTLFRIRGDGNTGIGTSAPSKTLDVEGAIRAKNSAGSSGAEIDMTSGSTWRLRSNPTSGTNSYGLDFIKGSAGTDVKMSIDSSGNVGVNALDIKSGSAIHGTITTSSSSLTLNARNTAIMLFQSGGTEKMRLTPDALLIGTTDSSPNNNSNQNSDANGIALKSNGVIQVAKYNEAPIVANRTGSDGNIIEMRKDGSSTIVGSIGTANGDSITIGNSTGNLILYAATVAPSSNSAGGASDGVVSLGTDTRRFKDLYMSGNIQMGGNLDVVGQIAAYNNSSSSWGSMNFRGSDFIFKNSGGTERARLDSSGNLLVGKSSASYSTAGQEFRANGATILGRSGAEPLNLNRLDSDGGILNFNKDNTTVGSIGVTGGSMYIQGSPATGKSGLTFYGSYIEPRDNGAPADAAIDLGISSARFKDLHLSGSAYVDGLRTPTLGTSNLRLGVNAGDAIVSGGDYNTVVGDEAGTAITTGDKNVALGYEALATETTGYLNTAIGSGSLQTQNGAYYNVAVGHEAGTSVTTGIENTFIGALAADALTDADYNVAVGSQALSSDTLGSRNTAIGRAALYSQNFTTATNAYNTAVGYGAGSALTTGLQNTFIGGLAGDATTTASNNTALGYVSLSANTTGANNVAVGANALQPNTTGGNNTALGKGTLASNTTASNNTAVGFEALVSNTTGSLNVALGALALDANTTGSQNIGIGYEALSATTTGNFNIAIGTEALESLTTASNNVGIGNAAGRAITTGTDNTLIGTSAGDAITTASHNTAVGKNALGLTTADGNTAVGRESLSANTTGVENTAVGKGSLQSNTTASNNIAVGKNALFLNTTGAQNVAVGHSALDANTTADNNVAVGYVALTQNTTGASNTAVGNWALQSNTSASNNTGVGFYSLLANTTGIQNTALGAYALDANTTGNYNVGLGVGSLGANTVGSKSTGIGTNALFYQNPSSATDMNNVALGHHAGFAVTTGINNTFIGSLAGDATDDATNCVAVGKSALSSNCGDNNTAIGAGALLNATSANNTAVGKDAGISVTTADENTLIGASAGDALTVGNNNVAVGSQALSTDTQGDRNVAVGRGALYSQNFTSSTDSYNTAVGYAAGEGMTTGYNNTLLGALAGDGTVTTGGGNIIIGYGSELGGAGQENQIVLATNSAGKGSSTAFISANGGNTFQGNNSASWATVSDERLKKNITSNTEGLSIINQVVVRNFEYKTPDEVESAGELAKSNAVEVAGTQLGVIAQELAEVCADCVIEHDTGVKSVQSDKLNWHMINAIKELSAQVEALTARIETLEG